MYSSSIKDSIGTNDNLIFAEPLALVQRGRNNENLNTVFSSFQNDNTTY
jgi:hypothetical protein